MWNEVLGESSSDVNYFLASCVVFIYIPIALLVIIYSIILIKLNSQKIPGQQSVNAGLQRATRSKNVLKMAIAIVLGFALCWLPCSIINMLSLFAFDRTLPCGIYLYDVITWLIAVANCAINPVICFTFSGNYREALKKLCKC